MARLKEELRLKDIIDVDVLMNAQKKISDLLNFSIITADPEGNTVGDFVNFIPFCDLIRSSPVGAKRCEKSGAILSERAYQTREVCFHDCHMGLKDCAAAIIVDGKYLGAVLGGQAFIEGEEYRRNNFDVEKLSRELDLPEDKLKAAIAQIPVVPEAYIYSCLDCYGFLANYFAEIGMKNITQMALLKESEEKLEIQKKVRNAQLKTIEAQINPHFLFNTLNSIGRMAMFEDAPKTEEMILCLSGLLRYNLKQKEEFPKIRTELENIRRYLFIQDVRYQDRISYRIDVPDTILDYRIPAMILQPIVENAIIHGLEPRANGGRIFVTGKLDANDVIIIVKDTGVGFSAEKLKMIMDEDDENVGLGIMNSNGRLKDYFGSGYGLTIRSIPDTETVVEIKLPSFKGLPHRKNRAAD